MSNNANLARGLELLAVSAGSESFRADHTNAQLENLAQGYQKLKQEKDKEVADLKRECNVAAKAIGDYLKGEKTEEKTAGFEELLYRIMFDLEKAAATEPAKMNPVK